MSLDQPQLSSLRSNESLSQCGCAVTRSHLAFCVISFAVGLVRTFDVLQVLCCACRRCARQIQPSSTHERHKLLSCGDDLPRTHCAQLYTISSIEQWGKKNIHVMIHYYVCSLLQTVPDALISIFLDTFPDEDPSFSMVFTRSNPSTTSPKTT